MGLPGQTFPGEGTGVQIGIPLQNHAVDGDFLTGLYHYHTAHRHFIRIHLFQSAFPLYVGIVGPDIHKGTDVAAALSHGITLEKFPHLVEEHYGDGLVVVSAFGVDSQGNGPDGGHGHEEIFIAYPAVYNTFAGFSEDVIANQQVDPQIQSHPNQSCDRQKV